VNGGIFGKYNGASEPAPEDIVDRKKRTRVVVVEHEGNIYKLHEGDTFRVSIAVRVDSPPGASSQIDLGGHVFSNVKIVSIK
jgi:hypothetical protein